MNPLSLSDLRASVLDTQAFTRLDDYRQIGVAFLDYLAANPPTRIVSPTHNEYCFYQYGPEDAHRITRPLNTHLFISNREAFDTAFDRFLTFLGDLKQQQEAASTSRRGQQYLATNEINRIVYTLQQSIGCIADSFAESNQARKRAGQLFEILIQRLLQEVGVVCESRTLQIPIPGQEGYIMRYELDMVFSRQPVLIATEEQSNGTLIKPAEFLAEQEIVGSVKTTSKDRIDKVFLDKYMLTQLLGRDVPVVAIFLHDVQRATAGRGEGRSIFGVASTFKTGHFLGYTVALNRLDGVYYVDPRPEMRSDPRLQTQISDFQQFLTSDLWKLSR